ncbi:hypothetical protein [Hymenobacter elongatus]|uniref:Uncharacterized protein n=1 Tax=Hymenobacter elongatus TaxID=877208 RepID=A0A4Z0PRE6_9BACT|nr:hypothetical protein [Hymenobacter elongatus]TGE18994.1 hypothetical protein E5J99_04415 [Hymenobacter elongatus]
MNNLIFGVSSLAGVVLDTYNEKKYVRRMFSLPAQERKIAKHNILDKISLLSSQLEKLGRMKKEDVHHIAIDLPPIFRILLMDSPSMLSFLNKYELHVFFEIPISKRLLNIDSGYMVEFVELSGNVETISVKDFTEFKIGRIDERDFTIAELVLSLAYSGVIHINPEKDIHRVIYEKVIVNNPELCMGILKNISNILLNGMKPIHESFKEVADAYSIGKYRPQYIEEKRKVLFNESMMQTPIITEITSDLVIFFNIDFQDVDIKKGYIMSIGKISTNESAVYIYQNKKTLIISLFNGKSNHVSCVDISLGRFVFCFHFKQNSSLDIYRNTLLVSSKKVSLQMVLRGKIVIGANLKGGDNGRFLLSDCMVMNSANLLLIKEFMALLSNNN